MEQFGDDREAGLGTASLGPRATRRLAVLEDKADVVDGHEEICPEARGNEQHLKGLFFFSLPCSPSSCRVAALLVDHKTNSRGHSLKATCRDISRYSPSTPETLLLLLLHSDNMHFTQIRT